MTNAKLWTAVTTAAIAASAPVAAAIYGNIAKGKELAIAREEQDFKVRMAFLDRATDPQRQPADRQLVLRFLTKVVTDKPMLEWANGELKDVEGLLAAMTKERDAALEKAQKATLDAERANHELESRESALRIAQSSSKTNATEIARLKREVQEAKEKSTRAESTKNFVTLNVPLAAVKANNPFAKASWRQEHCVPKTIAGGAAGSLLINRLYYPCVMNEMDNLSSDGSRGLWTWTTTDSAGLVMCQCTQAPTPPTTPAP